MRKGLPPSAGAKSTNFRLKQRIPPIYDGRLWPWFCNINDCASHRTFPSCVCLVLGRYQQWSPWHIIKCLWPPLVNSLIEACAIYEFDTARDNALNSKLGHFTKHCSHLQRWLDSFRCCLNPPLNKTVLLLPREDKCELGDGGCDLTIQAGLSMARLWRDRVCIVLVTSISFFGYWWNLFL